VLGEHASGFGVQGRADNPLLILRLGELPYSPPTNWENRSFGDTTFQPGLERGAYSVLPMSRPGRRVTLSVSRITGARDLPINPRQIQFRPFWKPKFYA